ncbi:hypothetical protein WDW89_20970 [Deltaproteobacteria bacterium TL4]
MDYYLSKSTFGEVLVQYAKSAAKKYRLRKEEWAQIKKIELSDHNKDVYIDFIVGSANYHEPEFLVQFFFETIKKFQFDNWQPLRVSILLNQDEFEIGRSDQTPDVNQLGRLDKAILQRTLKEFYIEAKDNNISSTVYAAWAMLWDLEEELAESNGLAVLVRNYPSLNSPEGGGGSLWRTGSELEQR